MIFEVPSNPNHSVIIRLYNLTAPLLHPSSYHHTSPRQLFRHSLLVFTQHLAQWGEGPEHSSGTHKSC